MRQVLVLGGAGMLGRMLVRILSQSDALVVANSSRTSSPAKGEGYYFDVENGLSDLEAILDQHGPFDYAINCIGILRAEIEDQDSASVRRAIRVNSLFPHELAALAQERGVRIIHISTDGVFSGASAAPLLEDSAHDCTELYGRTKSLGEVIAPGFLNLRCSIIGPDPVKKKGILEWFLAQSEGDTLNGYVDHVWTGVTTLQFARLCQQIILENAFDRIRAESPVHHFCPNRPLSKYELLQTFKLVFNKNVNIRSVRSPDGGLNRILATRYHTLPALAGSDLDIAQAVSELRSIQPDI